MSVILKTINLNSQVIYNLELAFVRNIFQNGYLSTLIDMLKHLVRLPEHNSI